MSLAFCLGVGAAPKDGHFGTGTHSRECGIWAMPGGAQGTGKGLKL